MTKYSSWRLRRLERQGGKVWQGVVSYKDDQGKWRQRTRVFDPGVRTKKQANEALASWRNDLEAEESKPEDAFTLTPSYVATFLSHKHDLADTTADSYRYAQKNITRPELNKPLSDLEPRDVQRWLYALEDDGKGAATREKAFRLLNQACENAVRMRDITFNPCKSVTRESGRPKQKGPDPNPLDGKGLESLNAVLDIQGHTRYADACRIALLTGMRQGEICGLKWREIPGWETGEYTTLTVRNVISRSSKGEHDKPLPKNETPRKIPISKELAEVLNAQRDRLAAECAAVGVRLDGERYVLGIPGNPGEGFYSPGYLTKEWRMFSKSLALMGVKGRRATFHDLRHTFATHSLISGVDVVTVSAILGHKDKSVTLRIYAEFLPDRNAEAMEYMGPIMSKAARSADIVMFSPTGTEG